MNLNFNYQNLKTKVLELASILKKYSVILFILLSLGILGYLVTRIKTLANHEPSIEMVNEKLNQNQSFVIDESIVRKIEQLKETNVDVKAIFEQTRDNPFQE